MTGCASLVMILIQGRGFLVVAGVPLGCFGYPVRRIVAVPYSESRGLTGSVGGAQFPLVNAGSHSVGARRHHRDSGGHSVGFVDCSGRWH